MNKHKFTDEEHFAIWEQYGGICLWCERQIDLFDATVDHIIPESLIDDPVQFRNIREMYGLSEGFQINDFENWVLCHHSCNSKKGKGIFSASPMFLLILENAQKRAPRARKTKENLQNQKSRGRILGRLKAAVNTGLVREADILWLFNSVEPRSVDDRLPGQRWIFEITPEFSVVQTRESVELVQKLTDELERTHEELDAARNQLEEYTCRYCGAQLSERFEAPTGYRGDTDLREVFECGYVTFGWSTERPCPADPLFPKFEDFELRYENEAQTGDYKWKCSAYGNNSYAQKVWLSPGYGSTQEKARSQVYDYYIRGDKPMVVDLPLNRRCALLGQFDVSV